MLTNDIKGKLEGLIEKAQKSIESAENMEILNNIRVSMLGKKESLHRC